MKHIGILCRYRLSTYYSKIINIYQMTGLYSDPIYRSVLTEFKLANDEYYTHTKSVFLENLLFIVVQ